MRESPPRPFHSNVTPLTHRKSTSAMPIFCLCDDLVLMRASLLEFAVLI
jgi:hypothetical protein